MTDHLGAQVLDSGALPYELALADTEAAEFLGLDVGAILDNWDPFAIPARNLPLLAHSMGVLLWDDDWPEAKKRQWIADQWRFKALRGTETAIRMALDLYGFTLVEMLVPPQGTYASEEFTKAQRNAWVRKMPQLRIGLVAGKGKAFVDSSFVGFGFVGDAFVEADDGPELYGRRGYLRQNGVDTPLRSEVLKRSGNEKTLFDLQRIEVAGTSTLGYFVGVDFVGEPMKFTGAAELEARIITVDLDRGYVPEDDPLGLDLVEETLEPISPKFERQSDRGKGGLATFVGADFVGDSFVIEDDAGELLADVLYLNDPAVAVPLTAGISFVGIERVGIEVNTAELMIDLHSNGGTQANFAGDGFVGEAFLIPEDNTARDNAIRAVLAAKSLRDTVLVTFETQRPLEFGDDLTDETRAGDWVRNNL